VIDNYLEYLDLPFNLLLPDWFEDLNDALLIPDNV
jgi:hypothetical protein